ncbi:magnesium-translocating P-type ATPase [Bradyrhizobium sp.]|uniref:magnesium-translocating P-type ATPase n=1 Tax=Bradyrhizobium sp. TaxID=376 RepID=UPI002C76B676|nr:magnesium-translocating P-type ATPase [Bradyrhizobium sp.]HMM90352.1 magnesium-translocating P-type ATPase [Bradyrhizobium sp.]
MANPFWYQTNDALLTGMVSQTGGLSQIEAERRFRSYGPNRTEMVQSRSILHKLGQRLLNPLVAILLVAAAISGFSGDVASFVIISSAIAMSLALDIVQEHRAELAAEALRQSVAIHADVVRDDAIVVLPVSRLVPGDIVHLRTGDLVPADGVVLETHGLQINEALMTGEPFPTAKEIGPCPSTQPAEAHNALFSGTSVVGGDGVMLVVETGSRTRFGAIAAALEAHAPPSAIEEGVRRLGMLILYLTLFLTLFVLLAHLAAHRPAMESFLFAVALAVGLTPELLPMVMTVTLAHGAQRMSARKVIVKRLSAIHDLGAMDVLCVDKTGTLTEARITLEGYVNAEAEPSARVLELARLNSAFQGGVRSPMDDALLAEAPPTIKEGWTCLSEVPFDFQRRCMSVLAAHGPGRLLIVKGAPEAIMSHAVAVEINGLPQPLDREWIGKIERLQNDYSRNGFRLLAVAVRSLPDQQCKAELADERDLTLIGFCIFADPPKRDAGEAVTRMAMAGIRLKIISGDHAAVVDHVAAAVGLSSRRMLTGVEIDQLSDSGLLAKVDDIDLFVRVDPDQKRRIVHTLRLRGHVVGFLGDGVNDAPAIHAAHVGLSVSGATEVARAAADIILLEQDLSVLDAGIREGRRTFANILKYVRMGASSNFGNMLSMALASVVLPFLPLLPLQILLNNLLYDLSEVGIPFDEVDQGEIAKPQSWDMGSILRFTLVMGGISSLFDAATFGVLLKFFQTDAALFQTGWFLESTATQILVIFLIRSRQPLGRSNWPHPVLIATSCGALVVSIALATGPFRSSFGFVALPAGLAIALALITVAYLAVTEIAKRFAFAGLRQQVPQSVSRAARRHWD